MREDFKRWCDEHRYTMSGVAQAALVLMQHLPPRLRDLAICGDWATACRWLEAAERLTADEAFREYVGEQLRASRKSPR
ncbi:MAG TPA: hypothetical protein PKY77_10890 [Phycisphaerae bacterium]|nr:hypothetical protein [Phycisphaerae bacterium]HRY70087.1 hypothetical protein [Phycisphaerae bacterium]HSA27363.1 hypothetical protein [Phycisphaerae bacterium]